MTAAEVLEKDESVRVVSADDRQRLTELYVAHHQVIWRTLRRLGFTAEAAADYTQQAYLIALERLDRIYEGSEKAFLFSTAIYFGRTAARKERRLELSDEVDSGSDSGSAASIMDQRQVALQLLERVLGQMPEDLVTVFSLYEIEGLSSPEIAAILEIPLGTVASRLRRARQEFRAAASRLELARRPLVLPGARIDSASSRPPPGSSGQAAPPQGETPGGGPPSCPSTALEDESEQETGVYRASEVRAAGPGGCEDEAPSGETGRRQR